MVASFEKSVDHSIKVVLLKDTFFRDIACTIEVTKLDGSDCTTYIKRYQTIVFLVA